MLVLIDPRLVHNAAATDAQLFNLDREKFTKFQQR